MLAAIGAVIVVPLLLTFMGMSTPAERLLSIVRWPVLLIVVILGLAALYRYGPSRQSAKWRWVTWGSTVGAVLWILHPCCSPGMWPASKATIACTARLEPE